MNRWAQGSWRVPGGGSWSPGRFSRVSLSSRVPSGTPVTSSSRCRCSHTFLHTLPSACSSCRCSPQTAALDWLMTSHGRLVSKTRPLQPRPLTHAGVSIPSDLKAAPDGVFGCPRRIPQCTAARCFVAELRRRWTSSELQSLDFSLALLTSQ